VPDVPDVPAVPAAPDPPDPALQPDTAIAHENSAQTRAREADFIGASAS
jgi:hypothetical protein